MVTSGEERTKLKQLRGIMFLYFTLIFATINCVGQALNPYATSWYPRYTI